MGFKNAFCDDCNKDIIDNKYFVDYDDVLRCEKCYLKFQIHEVEYEIKQKKEWLENTHLKYLKEWQNELEELQKRLLSLEGKQ